MTLTLIGLGLGDEKDITLRGLEAIKKANTIYLEHYTAILGVKKETLEEFYQKPVLIADRDLVEKGAEEFLLEPAKTKNIVLLIVGDPFGATTHTDLMLRAKEMGVTLDIIHNASILNAIGVVGLELYKFGKTTSIPYWDEGFEPESAYEALLLNQQSGLHTLCLLDIKVKEPTKEELRKGKTAQNTKNPPVPRFMSVQEGLSHLQKMEAKQQKGFIHDDLLVIGVARIGQTTQIIKAGSIKELMTYDFGAPLHSIIIPGKLHVVEEEALSLWK